jgi:hypothetical protein
MGPPALSTGMAGLAKTHVEAMEASLSVVSLNTASLLAWADADVPSQRSQDAVVAVRPAGCAPARPLFNHREAAHIQVFLRQSCRIPSKPDVYCWSQLPRQLIPTAF